MEDSERRTFTDEEALAFHKYPTPGKIAVVPTKPMATQRDLSLAYSPGVAVPVRVIADNPEAAYDYTSKGNLVAVISNGTAILGLGNLGALASKPVMEGKCVLFKRFADVDSIDIEVSATDPDEIITVIKNIGVTFGGINLEDIKSPECFRIETELQELLDIPVMHDDQHGTAIISSAGLINACKITGRKLEDVKLVLCGAGAAGMASIELMKAMGVRTENTIVCDNIGVIYRGRAEAMNQWKSSLAVDTDKRTLAEAMVGADVVIGQGRHHQGDGRLHGPQSDHLRHGQSRPGNHAGGNPGGAPGRHYRHGTLGLSQPGQQRPGLSLHLPRRPGCARPAGEP